MKKVLVLSILITALIVYVARKPLLRDPNADIAIIHDASVAPEHPGMFSRLGDAALPPESAVVTEGAIAKRSSFFVEMRKSGLSPTDIDEVVRATRGTFDLKSVTPGQKYAIYSGLDGRIDSLQYCISHEKILRIRRWNDTYTASIDTLPYRVIQEVASGTIEHSLFASLKKVGADEELAVSLSVIFGWVIDFFKDIHPGDTYTILYEKKVYEDGVEALGDIEAARITAQGQPFNAVRFKTGHAGWNYYDLAGNSLQKALLRAPLKFSRISSSFKARRLHPVTGRYAPHRGIDYAAPYGTPVHSTGDGAVATASRDASNGNYIKIRHNRSYMTCYLHLSRFAKGIRQGVRVKQGQLIGYVGSTGLSTGPHLDYRIAVNGTFVNPATVKLPSKEPVPASEMKLFEKERDVALSLLMEGAGEGSPGKTMLVEKPVPNKNEKMRDSF
ncbi:MAG: peptidoglycan DD-metalloendopeptidase family protein [Chitinivibrionia bacterium]|nr:peptidoglycan DD-metalloendopeptidase family protein [Chitinivibrionia bacterium]